MRPSGLSAPGSIGMRATSAYDLGAPCRAAAWSRSPSQSQRMPNAASHSCVAFPSIASNTGASSPGEELMTPSTPAVELAPELDAMLGKRAEEHTSELQSRFDVVCRLLL